MKNSERDIYLDMYLENNANRQLEELKELLRIPSVSTQPDHKKDMIRGAQWLVEHLKKIGIEHVELIETDGHPLVYGDWLHAGDNGLTVTMYGHYDVQPAEPFDAWLTPPFEPSVREHALYARGTTDDKGQLFVLLKALEAFLGVKGKLPVNVKVILEGDEETGRPILATYLNENPEKLTADICLISDTALLSPEQPCIPYSLRGIWAGEFVVRGPKTDLHSGIYGGVIHNPAQALAEIIAGLHDPEGRVTVPGFYDEVAVLDPLERERLARVPQDKTGILEKTGAPALYGEPGFTPVEQLGARPTLEVNGIWGGFTGQGYKTVIPAEARVRIGCRVVPNQDPNRLGHLVVEHVNRLAPPTVSVDVIPIAAIGSVLIDPNTAAIRAASKAYEWAFGTPPILTREGGGIPVVSCFQNCLKSQIALMGFGLLDDNAHAPNEKIHLPNFYKGIKTVIYFLDCLQC
ncbi:MAG: dipeptidase [Candidatus Omnitrophota bacterium]